MIIKVFLLIFVINASNPANYFTDTGVSYAVQDTQRIVRLAFDNTHLDLGRIKKGEKRSFSYKFTNVGTEAVEIELVSACECTEVDWPRTPIQPGKRAKLDVIFDSARKKASETIEIDIHLKNTDPETGYPVMEIVSYSYILE